MIFFDRLERINIETFSELSECVTYKCTDKGVSLVANRNLFSKINNNYAKMQHPFERTI